MPRFTRQLVPAVRMLLVLTVLCGLAYPLALTGIGRMAFGDEVEGPFLDQKIASIKEHASQIEALYEVFGDEGFRRFMAKEGFVLAATKEA